MLGGERPFDLPASRVRSATSLRAAQVGELRFAAVVRARFVGADASTARPALCRNEDVRRATDWSASQSSRRLLLVIGSWDSPSRLEMSAMPVTRQAMLDAGIAAFWAAAGSGPEVGEQPTCCSSLSAGMVADTHDGGGGRWRPRWRRDPGRRRGIGPDRRRRSRRRSRDALAG